jgi:Zn-dependent protease
MIENLLNNPVALVLWIGVIILGITLHEAAHSYMARYLGDPTPEQMGRTTLDPLAHLDPLGTVLIFIVGFGWGKPAPFNPTYFKHYKRDIALTAVAGPVTNVTLSLLAAFLLKLTLPFSGLDILQEFLYIAVYANLILALFNLIPVPPLDGSKVLYAVIPDSLDHLYAQYERLGPILLIVVLLFGGTAVFTVLTPILNGVLNVAGLQ